MNSFRGQDRKGEKIKVTDDGKLIFRGRGKAGGGRLRGSAREERMRTTGREKNEMICEDEEDTEIHF